MSIALRQPIVDRAPYASAAELSADLAIIARSLRQTNAGDRRARPPARAAARRRRVRLPSRADRPQAELRRPRADGRRAFRRGDRRASTIKAWRGRARRAAAAGNLRSPRPLVSPFIDYGEETAGELAIFRAAADDPRANTARARSAPPSSPRPTASPTCWSSRCCSRRWASSRAAGIAALALVPLFETIEDLRSLRRRDGHASCRSPNTAGSSIRRAASRK